ncbi:hypothetical protein MANES_08G113300v8 [Manihot esculenta]|uniref:GATA-type domain-containing protein n=2 Tax=Manihot esculenta TaxID=3983 RepID=A0A2C9VHD0_MANES|nr:hypothetical protein MANES_08G113300v8 [Manihot esculenta]OAY43983.1 hypothetical protein MANES_08G113300v8 [Manihot esculenta]
MWRGGPAGPKSLYNACGIRYRKKRKTVLGLEEDSEKKRRKGHISTIRSSMSASSVNSMNGNELGESLKMRVIVMGEKMMCVRSSIVKKQRCHRRKSLERKNRLLFV